MATRRLPDGQVKAFYILGRHVEGLTWFTRAYRYKNASAAMRAILDQVCDLADEARWKVPQEPIDANQDSPAG